MIQSQLSFSEGFVHFIYCLMSLASAFVMLQQTSLLCCLHPSCIAFEVSQLCLMCCRAA